MAKSRRKQQNRAARTASAANPASTSSPTAAATRPATAPPRPSADPRAAERIQRQQARAAARRQQERQRLIRSVLLALIPVLIIGAGILWLISRGTFAPPPGRSVAIVQPFDHIPEGQQVSNYNTVPPTSGQHYANVAANGVHDKPIPNELQVHNLEHGQVVIQYTCTDCPELAEQLKTFAQRYPKWVIVAPYPDPRVGARIALTAWGYIDTFDEFDEQRITRFIDSYRNRGPERVIQE